MGAKNVPGRVTVRCSLGISDCLSFLFSVILENFNYQITNEGETKDMINLQLGREQGNSDPMEAHFLIHKEERRTEIGD